MSSHRFLSALLVLVLASIACSVNLTDVPTPPTPQPIPDVATLAPTPAPPTPTPEQVETPAPTVAPPTATVAAPAPALSTIEGLTLDQLKNAEVKIAGNTGAEMRTVKLTDGSFVSGSDRASVDYASVYIDPHVAYGDLNGDGAQDAAIIIGENYGGTGNFVSVVAMLNQNGQPVYAGSVGIDDRPVVNSLSIQDGEILLDVVIHGPNDPGCCAAQPVTESFRLWGGGTGGVTPPLLRTRFTSKTPGGMERIIKIDAPAPGSEISGPFTVNGSVTIAPFENNLAYAVFLEGAPEPMLQGGWLVDAAEMGGPGTFSLPLDFTAAGVHGNLRIEISDLSAADGSYLALATLFLTVK